MDQDQIHIPQRLEGESQLAYQARRRMSERLSQRGTLLVSSRDGKVAKARRGKIEKRVLVEAIGHRQAKRAIRAARADRRALNRAQEALNAPK